MQRGTGRDDYAEAGSGGYFGSEYESGGRGLGSDAERADRERGPRGLLEPDNDWSRARDRGRDQDAWGANGGERLARGNQSYGRELDGGAYAGSQRGREHRGERRSRWQREPLRARDVMTKDPRTVTPDSAIRDVAQIMKDENCGIVPVADEQRRLQGLVTDRDIVVRALADGHDAATVRVQDIMTEDIQGVTPDEELTDVIRLMGDKQIRRVPVVDRNDHLLGIISMADIATRADYDENLQDALEEISARRSFWSRIWS